MIQAFLQFLSESSMFLYFNYQFSQKIKVYAVENSVSAGEKIKSGGFFLPAKENRNILLIDIFV